MYKQKYIELLLRCGVMKFGEFKTKSGRLSPYFFNMGQIASGSTLGDVTAIYAECIAERFRTKIDNLYGPAYKGIPLATMTAEKLSSKFGWDVGFTFNRKEVKDHGEGGSLVGQEYKGGERVLIVEDVITGGTSIRESFAILSRYDIDVVGVMVGIDRQERGMSSKSALQEIAENYEVETHAIVTLSEIVDSLFEIEVNGKVWIDKDMKRQIDQYMDEFGVW